MNNVFKLNILLIFFLSNFLYVFASDMDSINLEWQGYKRYDFKFKDCTGTIIYPHNPAPGNPWIWLPVLDGDFSLIDKTLLEKGFHVAYYDLSRFYGTPKAIELATDFYYELCKLYKLSDKVTLEGIGLGSNFVFNWAASNSDKVACIYLDSPICDINSCSVRKNQKILNKSLKDRNVNDKNGMHKFCGNAIQLLDKLNEARIPLIGLCDDSYQTVPCDSSFKLLADTYRYNGGIVESIVKTGKSHNPEPVVDFILRYQKGYSDSQFVTFRHKLYNSFSKFIKEKKGCVAFLGGSITDMKGWRDQIKEDLQQRFPETDFTFIDAGIGSTGSVPHSFRLKQDVLNKGVPDLMFFEAAVNDFTNTPDYVSQIRGMEGVVRHARMVNPNMDILMLHFTCDGFLGYFRNGIIPDVIMNHERVANYYSITSINLAKEISNRIFNGEFTWKEFGGTHPSWFGHKYYTAAINRVFDDSLIDLDNMKNEEYAIPKKPLDNKSYFKGTFLDIRSAKSLKGFRVVDNWKPENSKGGTRKGFFDVPMLVGLENESSFELEFNGRAIGYFGVCGPDSGIISYTIDGKEYKDLNTYTAWSGYLYIPWLYILADDLSNGKHTLKVTLKKGKGSALHIRNFTVIDNGSFSKEMKILKNEENTDYYFEDYKK